MRIGITADNYVICIAATFAVCSLASEVAQNGWPAQYGTMLMINLALDLLLIALLIPNFVIGKTNRTYDKFT